MEVEGGPAGEPEAATAPRRLVESWKAFLVERIHSCVGFLGKK